MLVTVVVNVLFWEAYNMSFPTLGSFKGGGGSTSVTPVVSPLVFRALQVTFTYLF